MKNMFATIKTTICIFVFIFLSSNLAYAAVPTIGTLESNQNGINSTNETNVSFNLKGISDTDTNDTMTYKYSWDNVTFTDLTNKSTQKEFTASEDLSKGTAVYNLPEFSITLLQESSIRSYEDGINTKYNADIFDFTTSSTHKELKNINIRMRQTSLNNANVYLKIINDAGATVFESSVHQGIIPNTLSWVEFNFNNELLPNTHYRARIYEVGNSYVKLDIDNNSKVLHQIFEEKPTGFGINGIGKATSIDTTKSEFIGFVTSNITAGNPVLLDVAGDSMTQQLLGSGSTYYLSDTLGGISTTPGTISKTIGTAINDTTIQLVNSHYSNAQIAFTVDSSSQPDGDITLYVKANDGSQDSNVVTFAITKNSIAPVITIVEPVTDSATQTISATIDKGSLTMSITNGDICDSSLSFEGYNVPSFNKNLDNGKKVCYRAIDTTGNTSYKLSTKVWGIAKGSYMGGDIFYGYTNWYSSPYSKANDSSLAILKLMESFVQGTSQSTSYPSSFIDINGDGLVDMLYIDEKMEMVYPSSGGHYSTTISKYAILTNNGDMTFDTTYICYQLRDLGGLTYYGDCAE